MRAGKIALAVGAGAVLWAALWVGGAMLLAAVWPAHVAADRSVNDPTALLAYIAYSVVLSIVAGYMTAKVAAAPAASRAVAILAALQLFLGIMIEVSAWSLTPAWYHITFLLLLVPATLYGGRLGSTTAAATRYAAG
jgi:hypothetical protein